MQTCIWPSWCHCHSLSLASVKSRMVLPFWYRLTRVVPEKKAVKHVCEFYFKIQYFNFDWKIQSHFFTVTETLNSEKSDSYQCYSESESATAHCSHSTVVSTYFTTWMFCSLITKHINNRHDVTATVDKTLLCKIRKSADAKKLFHIHTNNVVLNSWILLNFKRPRTEFSIYGDIAPTLCFTPASPIHFPILFFPSPL